MELSHDQQQVFQSLKDFIVSDQQCFVLKGYAGTGKTTMLKHFVEELQVQQIPFKLLAPTGRAAKNIVDRLQEQQVNASTIHSYIYEHTENKDDAADDLKVVFKLKNIDLDKNLVLIIDEASMISHVKHEQDMLVFGSGNLLVDLLKFMSFENSHRKIIFVGDDLQLPPIGDAASMALQPEVLSNFFDTPIGYGELTEVFRQKEGGLLTTATKLREEMKKGDFTHLPIEADRQEIKDVSYEQAIHDYQHDYGKNSIFLAESNREVHSLNMIFRKKQALAPNHLERRERLVVMRNARIDGHRIYNGEFLFVKDIGKIEEKTVSYKKKGGGIGTMTLQFQDVTVAFYNEYNRATAASCKILLHKLWEDNGAVTEEEKQALATLFSNEHPHLKKGSAMYKEALKRDEYFNALHVRFGYAITCHKAQGGEWDHVYSLLTMSRSLYCLDAFRWIYTAMTRAKKTITFVDLPRTSQPIDASDPLSIFRPLLLEQLTKLGYDVINTDSKMAYGEKFTLKKGSMTAVLRIHYTGKGKLGAALKEKGTLDISDIVTLLATKKGKQLSDLAIFE